MDEIKVQSCEVIEAINRSEVDIQIATAHRFPRSMELFQKRSIEMVSQDSETAASCIYRRPVGKDESGKQKIIEGESIRLAEIVAGCYGNLRVSAMFIEQTDKYVRCRGAAHDLESNFAATSESVESIIDSKGKKYSDRQIIVTVKAALSKARRDAIFMVVPKALCKSITKVAREVAVGTKATLKDRVMSALKWTAKHGIKDEDVFKTLDVKGISDIGLEELETLTGLKTAINEGDITAAQAFDTEKKSPAAGGQAVFDSEKPNTDLSPPQPPQTDKDKLIETVTGQFSLMTTPTELDEYWKKLQPHQRSIPEIFDAYKKRDAELTVKKNGMLDMK